MVLSQNQKQGFGPKECSGLGLTHVFMGFAGGSAVKNLPAVKTSEMWV